jgi:hypothetical protein
VNCSEAEIDIAGGRIRHTRYLLWVPISQVVVDSALTKALPPDDKVGLPADWHPVVTLSPGLRHSPHYRFHGAFSDIRILEFSWECGTMTPEARRASAQQVLRLWQEDGSDLRARRYIQLIWERVQVAEQAGEEIDEGDLPDPE